MTTQTYCTIADVKDILSDHGVLVAADDNENELVDSSGTESTVYDNAIERAAVKINMALANTKYTLAELASLAWMKWCNAVFAAVALRRRRGNPCPLSLLEDMKEFLETLKQIQTGQLDSIAGVAAAMDCGPAVSNLTTEPWRKAIVRRRDTISTGSRASGTRKTWDETVSDDYII